jgi:putative mRNA 3-end processing factor
MHLIEFTDKGLYCPLGQFYIDPWKPVEKAVITHAHSDHAKGGSGYYLCHSQTKPLLQLRLGDNRYETVGWGEPVFMNGIKLSLHPAGHMIGSSQIRIEHKGEVWVVSGDYKIENDGLSGGFEPVLCNTFVTESTFGLPVYNWKTQQEIYREIIEWVLSNKKSGRSSVLIAYSLGKAQRVLQCLSGIDSTIFVHGAIANVQETLANAGWKMPPVQRVLPDTEKELLKGSIILAPPGAEATPWLKRFAPYSVGICSGWMQIRGNIRRSNADAGFALSDHADWNGLLFAIQSTGAQKVFVTHGFQAALSRYLREKGVEAEEVKTEFGKEEPLQSQVADDEET